MPLIDKYVPAFSFSERHSLVVNASPEFILSAVRAYRPESDPFFRVMIGLRELPARIINASRRKYLTPTRPFGIDDFTVLGQDDQEVVFGLIGRFWRSDFGLADVPDGAAFAAFDEAGFVKLALNFATYSQSDGRILLTCAFRRLRPPIPTDRDQ
jgi:hypothetical protein